MADTEDRLRAGIAEATAEARADAAAAEARSAALGARVSALEKALAALGRQLLQLGDEQREHQKELSSQQERQARLTNLRIRTTPPTPTPHPL